MSEETPAREPMAYEPWNETAAAKVIGKTILVGLTHIPAEGGDPTHEQFFGVIDQADLQRGLRVALGDGGERWLPPQMNLIFHAARGSFTLRDTGEVIKNPDFISRRTLGARET